MYKHIQGRTSFFTPARFKSCLFFKFLLIYSKPVVLYSGEFLTKTTAAPSQEVVEGRSWYFLKRIRSWELNKHDLKRAGVKKDVLPCICLYIDSIFTWIVTRPCGSATNQLSPDYIHDNQRKEKRHVSLIYVCTVMNTCLFVSIL